MSLFCHSVTNFWGLSRFHMAKFRSTISIVWSKFCHYEIEPRAKKIRDTMSIVSSTWNFHPWASPGWGQDSFSSSYRKKCAIDGVLKLTAVHPDLILKMQPNRKRSTSWKFEKLKSGGSIFLYVGNNEINSIWWQW